MVICAAGLYVVVFLAFYLPCLALLQCAPPNRTMAPARVLLNFIPLFNVVWSFVTVVHVHRSLRNEYRARGWRGKLSARSLWTGLSAWAPSWLWVSLFLMCGFVTVKVPPVVATALGWGWLLCTFGYLAIILALSRSTHTSLTTSEAGRTVRCT